MNNIFGALEEDTMKDPMKDIKIKADLQHTLQYIITLTCFNTSMVLKNEYNITEIQTEVKKLLEYIKNSVEENDKEEINEIKKINTFNDFIDFADFDNNKYTNEIIAIVEKSLEGVHDKILESIQTFTHAFEMLREEDEQDT